MGKKKQAQRTKNNAVPASSGRSAELLQSTSGVPFVGFTTLKEGGFIPMLSGLTDDLDVNINEDFRLVWKKMSKKDTTTKLKALDEFKKLCQDCDVEMLKPVLPFWPRVYSALSTDEEHRVREAAHIAHRALVIKAGRNIAPYLKQLVGSWFTGQHDTYAPAASAAQAAFQEAFPPNKLIEAIVFCQEEILNYICDNLLNQTPQTLANSQNRNCSEEAKDARYERVIVSCLNGYALYLLRLPAEHLHKAEESNRKLVTSAKFWKFNKHFSPIVRAAWFTALVALCEKAGFLLRDEAKHVCMAVFTNLEETDPAVIRSLWQAVLLVFIVVDDVWNHVSLEKLVLPKLWKVLREGADGNASLVFPNLLPLLSKIPTTLLNDKNKFYSKFFDSLQAGLKVRSVQMSASESNAVVTAFLESIRYLISLNTKDNEFCLSLVENQVFSLVEVVLSEPKLHLSRSCLFSSLGSQINHWSRQCEPPFTSMTNSFWKWLGEKCQELLQFHLSDPEALNSNCTALQSLLTTLKTPYLHQKKSFKVKFVSPKKSNDSDEDELSPTAEPPSMELAPAFTSELNQFIDGQLRLCFHLMESCGQQAQAVLVSHFATIIQDFHSDQVFHQVVSVGGGTWKLLYQRWLAQWLKDDNIPLHLSLKLTFTLLQYVQVDSDVQLVFTDLSKGKWQHVVEWALKPQNQSVTVCQWLQLHGGVCRLLSLLTRNHTSYNTLHNSLRNLRQNCWLTTTILGEIISGLRHNLTDPSIVEDVKTCSADLLQAMLQNDANHSVLARLTAEDLQSLLYELFTATLQHLPHFPVGWHYCLSVLALQSRAHLGTAYNTCIDLLIAVARSRSMDLADSQQMVSVLEQLILAAAKEEEGSLVEVALSVISHLAARAAEHAPAVWGLFNVAHFVSSSLRDVSLPCGQQRSYYPDDPLSSIPLQQYITTMIPLLVFVVRLQTTNHQEKEYQLPYAQLKAGLLPEDVWDWTLQILQLHSVCVTIQNQFGNTKQYFTLKEKITFILVECGLLSQLRVKDLLKHLNLSLFEEGSSSLVNDPLTRLQTQVVLKDLSLLYDVHQIKKELMPLKSTNSVVKLYYFSNEYLEELAAVSGLLKKDQLPTINTCCCRLTTVDPDAETHISILDRIYDQFVSKEKENRSLFAVPPQDLNHITEVADFACHSVSRDFAHLQQSSWDACLVATAALTLSIASSLVEVPQSPPAPQPLAQTAPQPSVKPWPLSLLSDTPAFHEDAVEDSLSLPLVRVVCSVCRLFNAVSAHMNSVDPEDKAAMTRCTEWNDVFLPGTQTALTRAWLAVAEMPCEWPSRLLLVEALGSSVTQFVQYPHFVLDHSTMDSLDTCCRLLQSAQPSVQLTAYQLLLKLIPAMVDLDMKQCEKDNIALSCSHFEQALVHTQSIIEIILSELSFGDLCIVEPFTDSYRFTRCYLLLWCALLELCGNASSQLRALYTTWLKEEYLPVFLKVVFCLMPEAARHGEVASQRISQLFTKTPQFDKGVWGSERLAHLSCWVFARCLRRLPAAIRQWWNEADHRIYGLVEHITATYVSPDICAEEMRSIQTHEKKLENMTVQVHHTTKEVYAVYTFEESNMELAIELAHNHPLGLVKVRSGQRMVSTTQTRQWLMQITILLTHQNGSIWDALELWKHSVDKRFEGVEECYICFAILHSINHQMPKLSCQTCRKKFHSHCLYKWFTTSHKSTCPICRNMFSPFTNKYAHS